MPAPILRHDRLASSATAGTIVSTTAVPANRAFVVSKVAFNWFSGAVGTFTLYAGSSASNSTIYVSTAPLSAGEVWTETGLVLASGEFFSLSVSVSNAGGVGTLHVFGQEVDI